MLEYVETQNVGNAQSIVVRMNTLMGYPNPPTKTESYGPPDIHQLDVNKTGAQKHLVVIKEVWAPSLGRNATIVDIDGQLSPGERNDIKTKEVLEAEGAFGPVPLNTEAGDPLLLEDGTSFILESNLEEVL